MLIELLQEDNEKKITDFLMNIFREENQLSNIELIVLADYETEDYALVGIIGLILNDKSRILLGKKQSYEPKINNWCHKIEVSYKEFEAIAMKYLDDDYSNDQEVVLRKVMLEYPKKMLKL